MKRAGDFGFRFVEPRVGEESDGEDDDSESTESGFWFLAERRWLMRWSSIFGREASADETTWTTLERRIQTLSSFASALLLLRHRRRRIGTN